MMRCGMIVNSLETQWGTPCRLLTWLHFRMAGRNPGACSSAS